MLLQITTVGRLSAFIAAAAPLFLVPHRSVFANVDPLIHNPASFSSVEELILAVLQVVVVIATPIIVLFIIYAGFLYVTARGNQDQLRQATRAITYAIIGAVLVLGAVALANVVADLIGSFQN